MAAQVLGEVTAAQLLVRHTGRAAHSVCLGVCTHVRQSRPTATAPAQGNQSLSRELRASALCPPLEGTQPVGELLRSHQGCQVPCRPSGRNMGPGRGHTWSSPAGDWIIKLMSIESVMPSSHLILCCPLLLLPPILASIRVFSNEGDQ